MRAILLLLIASACFVACDKDDDTDSGNVDTWLRIYPVLGYGLKGVCETPNGIYGAFSVNDEQTHVLWFNGTGELTSQLSLGKYVTESAAAIASMHSGELLLAGYSGNTNTDIYVARTNGAVEGTNEKRIDLGDNDELAYDIIETADDCFMVCGRANNRFTIVKLSSEFDTLWTMAAGDASNSEARALAPFGDEHVVIVGKSRYQALILVIDLNGSIVNEQLIDESLLLTGVEVTGANEIFAAGTVHGAATVVKLDEALNVQSSTTLLSNEYGYFSSFALSSDDLPLMMGTKHSNYGTNNDIWISKIENNGEIAWTNYFLTSNDDYAAGIVTCSDGGIVMLGSFYVNDNSSLDLIIAKLNEQGEF